RHATACHQRRSPDGFGRHASTASLIIASSVPFLARTVRSPMRAATEKSETRMSDVGTAVPKPRATQPAVPADSGQNRVAELRVSGHLMTLDTGLFCVFQAPGSPSADDRSGLPGVRISLPPGP